MNLALPYLLQDVATDLKAPWLRVRKASWSHASNSAMPGECMDSTNGPADEEDADYLDRLRTSRVAFGIGAEQLALELA